MSYYDSTECNAAQDRAWSTAPQTSVAKLHAQVLGLRAELNSVWSENFDALRDQLIDEGCELNALLELLLKGEGAEAVERMDRIATKFCFAEAGK